VAQGDAYAGEHFRHSGRRAAEPAATSIAG
jgi:hypothetical protein